MTKKSNYMRRLDGVWVPPPSIELLKKMYVEDRQEASAVAKELGFNAGQICRLIWKSGITKSKPETIAQRLNLTTEAMRDLYVAKGKEAGEIADMYGEPVDRSRNLLARNGIK